VDAQELAWLQYLDLLVASGRRLTRAETQERDRLRAQVQARIDAVLDLEPIVMRWLDDDQD
jgi:hypothetical protein